MEDMRTEEQKAQERRRFRWGLIKLMAPIFLLFGAMMALLLWPMHDNEQSWKGSRELNVASVTEHGAVRVVTFTNTDSVLVFTHSLNGWFKPGLKLNTVRYLNNDGIVATMFMMTRPDGKSVVGYSPDDILIGREALLALLMNTAPEQ